MVATETKLDSFLSNIRSSETESWKNLKDIRSAYVSMLDSMSFPTTRDEYWKYTRTSKIGGKSFNFPTTDNNSLSIPINAQEITISNGIISSVGTQNGVKITSFADLSESDIKEYFGKEQDNDRNIFNVLNSAYFTDGILIEVKGNIENPIYFNQLISESNIVSQPRVLVVCDKGSSVVIVDQLSSSNKEQSLHNAVWEFFVDDSANCEYIAIQSESESIFNVNNVQAHQGYKSVFTSHHYSLNGLWVRNNTNIIVNGEHCESNLYGAYTTTGKQQVDNHTVVDHRVPNCESNELYKGTMNDKSTVTFNGKVFVRKDAQKINAFQSNNNILLSDDATINSKPELEIYADDVKCSHGSTTGQLDEDALFYLRSRGLSTESATNMLVGAFVGEVIENIDHDELKDYVKSLYGLD